MLGELERIAQRDGRAAIAITTHLPLVHPITRLWNRLPPTPLLLQPCGADSRGNLLLQYAALDLARVPVALDWQSDLRRVATWGIELTHALELVCRAVPAAERGHLAAATVFVDLADHVRLGFFTRDATRLPPEVNAAWPGCDERGLVFVAGVLLADLLDLQRTRDDHPIAELVQRCRSQDPVRRHRTLEALRVALIDLGGRSNAVLSPVEWRDWRETERAIGLALLEATQILRQVLATSAHGVPVAREAFDAILRIHPRRVNALPGEVTWAAVADLVCEYELVRDYRGALDLLRKVRPEPDSVLARCLALARCCLETNELGEAIEELGKVLATFPDHVEARRLHALTLVRTDRTTEALAACDAWLAVAPDDGAAHHARGKALLALGRPADARASFDRASQLAPGLVAAAMLRTNLDRQARDLRRDVGLDAHRQLEVPAHLPELAPILAAGRILDAIVWLTDRYDDPAARKLLATCHEYAGDLEAALVVYEHLADPRGMARCLIELGRAEEALALLDVDATELRADALDRLGRTEEAAQVRQHIAWER